MHDKKAQTSERVAWTETRNLHTDNIENASKVMAYTDMNAESLKRSFGGSSTGAKREAGAVYHFSLSEDPKNSFLPVFLVFLSYPQILTTFSIYVFLFITCLIYFRVVFYV